ncbi:autotransporter outer membrane beta-barrel domain-containing protein [Pseudomonas helleri]|uniref:autotransporter outer membrane beta-barrel domain-containing protein n=3 Tax=Pseudomonas TaxID=286 RepID=UPI000652CE48|nr:MULTISPECIES: autotransporter outer membrane beta-barrel domain-containing protein [Pseudomonas]
MPYQRSPLSHCMFLVAVGSSLFIAERVNAETVLVRFSDESISALSDPLNKYRVFNGWTLTANAATAQNIEVNKSNLVLNGSTVNGNGTEPGVSLYGSNATITGSTLTSNGIALRVAADTNTGSVAQVQSSTITGMNRGATVSHLSRLEMTDTTLLANAAEGIGLEVFNGNASAVRGTIVGGLNGIQIIDYINPEDSVIDLDSTTVTGRTGAAILVENYDSGSAHTQINVMNGSTLTGGNGNLLEVNGTSTATLRVSDSNTQLKGDVIAASGATANVILDTQATLTGRLENLSGLAINSQAQWVMVEDGTVSDLSMNGGSIKFGEPTAYYTLSVSNLSGAGGTFYMASDFSTGQTDKLDVTGTATGSHQLVVASSGADPINADKLYLVHTAAGDAKFSLLNDRIDLGAYSYQLANSEDGGATDWYLNPENRTISPGTQSAMALFNTAPTIWYGELTTLRTRMGELRIGSGQSGAWVRAYGNKYTVSASTGVGYKQSQQGLTFGADAPLPIGDGQWLAGLMAGYSQSDLDLDRGTSGTVDSYYAGAYTTWLDAQTGYYFDGVVKINRFQNKSDVNLSDNTSTKGSYSNYGVGASAEFGRHIKLDEGYFVEPYAQVSSVIIQGKDYDLDNGLRAKGDRTRSLLGELGSTVGRNIELAGGQVVQPYLRAAYVHEFSKNNEVKVNDNVFNNDLSGSRGKLGAGMTMTMTQKIKVYADVEYSKGDGIEQPLGGSVGVYYSW